MSIDSAIKRLREYIDKNNIDAVILNRRSSFSWFSQGESSMNFYTDFGLGYIYVDKNDAFCYTSNNEASRIEKEIFIRNYTSKNIFMGRRSPKKCIKAYRR